MTEPLIRVKQLSYVRVEAPDIAKAEKFLDEFGLQLVERSNQKTYLRGTDAQASCYILSQGAGSVTAIAFEADSLEDLQKVAELPEASQIESLDEPCGGHVVRLTDPMGMQVEIVTDPFQMLEVLAEFGPDLILLDMYMPECSGMELARVVRQVKAFVHVPIVFLSAETDREKQL